MSYGGPDEAERLRAMQEPEEPVWNCPACGVIVSGWYTSCGLQPHPPDPIGDALAFLDEALS